MSQLSQPEPDGNTRTSVSSYQSYRYFIVLPDESYTESQLSQHFKSLGCKKFTYQLERGEKDGYLHWSIELSLRNKEYFKTFKNLLGFNKAHIEPTKDYFSAKNYNSKTETRVRGPWNESSVFLVDELEGKKYYEWQQDIVDLYSKKPSRAVYWYWNEVGNNGKTSFARHMCIKYDGILYVTGKSNDIKYALTEYLGSGRELKMIFFDYPKSSHGYISYSAIEEVVNGIFFNGKYQSGMMIFNRPHVVCFSNMEPNYNEMSDDRWRVFPI